MKRETDWGLPTKEIYTPEDVKDVEYLRDINDAGEYPFVRGYFRSGYRSREPAKRITVGFGSAADTNQRLKYLRSKGEEGAISFIQDRPTAMCIDADHPLARDEAGVVGVSLNSVADMEEFLDGIPLAGQTLALNMSCAPGVVVLAQLIVVCEKRGVDPAELRGQAGLQPTFGVFGQDDSQPLDLRSKVAYDQFEYMIRNKMKLHLGLASQHARESGINLPCELAIALAGANEMCNELLARGLEIDDFAPRLMNHTSIGIRFFEEIAKVRALRKMWAKMMREEYKAKNPRSWHVTISSHTSGTSLTYQQPLNNIIRDAIEVLAGTLAGCTAHGVSTYDEPICEPTEQASRIALNTQYIVYHETGAMWTTDPLGGSYYVEYLTKRLEESTYKILEEIKAMGGLRKAIEKGWYEEVLMKTRYETQKAIEKGDRILVGVNELAIPPEEEDPIPIHEVTPEVSEAIVRRCLEFKAGRNTDRVTASLQHLYEDAQRGKKFNLMPTIIEATKNNATLGEIWGTIRLANGLSYDPFNIIESPFEFR